MSNPAQPPRAGRYLAGMLGVLVIGFGLSWVFSATARNAYMDQDYGQWTAKMAMIRDCHEGDLAIIGDSRISAGLIPALLRPAVVRNLALTGATPVEGYYEIKRILACPRPPKIILMSFAPRQYQEMGWFWLHAARYGFFTFAELEEVRRTEERIGYPALYAGAFGTEPPGWAKNWLYVHSFPPFNFPSILGAHGFGRRGANDLVRKETFASDGQHLEGTARCAPSPGWEATQAQFKSNALARIYLERLIGLVQSHGVRLEIMSPPISEMTSRAMAPRYHDGFINFMSEVVRTHPDIQMLGEPFPVMGDCFFGDQHHVNQLGAETFTRLMAPSIEAIVASADAQQVQNDRVTSAP